MTSANSDEPPASQHQSAGDVTIGGKENAFALINSDGNVAVDQSHHVVIYNYYQPEFKAVAIEVVEIDDNLPCPYRGLAHFGPEDAEFFFGREVFVAELVGAVQTRAFVPVLGASGSGKSSVVFAGLVPQLQRLGQWQFTYFRPGNDPFHAVASALVPLYTPERNETEQLLQARDLAAALQGGRLPLGDVIARIQRNYPQQRVLLIADQFEELYTLCPEEATRRQFLDCLLASLAPASTLSPLVLVATMRADFLGSALSYRPLADVLQAGDVKLGAMNREELCNVIEKPAAKLGVSFEPGLAKRILDAVDKEPGNLPLLEFALTELWKQRQGKNLTHAAYEAIGEVQGALARYADEQYARLQPHDQAAVRRIFVQLVRPGEGTEDTRRLATKAELGEDRWALVKQLADTRLVVTSQDGGKQETVEVVHEALIRHWGELRGWIATDREFLTWQGRLRGVMQQWEATNRDEGALLRGAALVEAGERLQKRGEDLNPAEQGFIQASLASQQHEQQQQELAQIETLMKFSKLLLESDRQFDALMVSLSAAQRLKRTLWVDGKAQAENAENVERLQQAVYTVKERNRLEGHTSAVYSMVLSSDGTTLASASADRTVKLWDIETGAERHTLKGHTGAVTHVVLSADGKTLASASDDNTVKLWDTETGAERHTLKGHSSTVWRVVLSADGKILVSASTDNTVKLWDTETGAERHTLKGHTDSVWRVVLSADGKTLASASTDNTVKLWDTETGAERHTLKGHTSTVWSVVLSADGKILASASADNTVKLWDTETGAERHTLKGHTRAVTHVVLSADGKTLASTSDDNTVKLWDTETGAERYTLKGHTSTVWSAVLSADGKTLASASADNTVKLWDTETGAERHTLKGHTGDVTHVVLSTDGKTLASASDDNTVKLWDIETGAGRHILRGHTREVYKVALSADGKTLASASADNTVKLWDTETRSERYTLKGHTGAVWSVVLSADGKTLASASADNTVKLWDPETGAERHTLKGHTSTVYDVVLSADGKTLASASSDTTVKLWDTEAGAELHTLKGHTRTVWGVVLSADGKTLASASTDKTVRLWDTETGAERHTLKGHARAIRDLVLSADGRTLASASSDATVKLWDTKTGAERYTLKGHTRDVRRVALSADGKILASASYDRTVKLWNTETGAERQTLRGHTSAIKRVVLSADGKALASASADHMVKLWDTETGAERHTLKGHTSAIKSLIFSADGKALASASEDSTILLWHLDTDFDLEVLRRRGCTWVRNYLQTNPNVSEHDRHICDDVPPDPDWG
jgi:WD40 repeat protein